MKCLICNKKIVYNGKYKVASVDDSNEQKIIHTECFEKLYLCYSEKTRLLYYLGYK